MEKSGFDALAGDFAGERPAPVAEPHRIGSLAVGPLMAKSWRGGGEPADFFALKGALEGLAGQLGVELSVEPAEEPFLHPGRSARVDVAGQPAGWIGELHPLVGRAWDLAAAVAFEVDLAALVAASPAGNEVFEDVTTFPAVYQDLAVVVPADVAAARLREVVLSAGGELLHAAEVFDFYEGEQLGEGKKSIALRLEFRVADRTLTDDEVVAQRAAIEAGLTKIGGSLRG
jgi:phenylalanyl-tRNA synthetase beta chain